jgi:hypothetical protein
MHNPSMCNAACSADISCSSFADIYPVSLTCVSNVATLLLQTTRCSADM